MGRARMAHIPTKYWLFTASPICPIGLAPCNHIQGEKRQEQRHNQQRSHVSRSCFWYCALTGLGREHAGGGETQRPGQQPAGGCCLRCFYMPPRPLLRPPPTAQSVPRLTPLHPP